MPASSEELQAPLEGRQQLDPVAERDTRMRVEGDHGRCEPRRDDGVEDGPVTPVHAVEGADRHRARLPLDFCWGACDVHPSLASASSAGTIVFGSASSTENGPISVRLSDRQCPPSASAIDRTYVPDETCSSRLATPSS